MNLKEKHIIFNTLHSMHASSKMIREQEEPASNYSYFTDIEKGFLGKFDAHQSQHLGIIYSLTDIGIREFMQRSGSQLNCTPGLLLSLIRKNIIKLVPSGGYGADTNYTIELQIPLNDVKGFGDDKKQDTAAGGDTGADTDTGGGGGAGLGGGDLGGGDLGGGVGYKDWTDILASRTYAESGDYYVKAFDLSVHESLNNGVGNRGIYSAGQLTFGGQTPSDDLMLYKFSPGRAFVRGYDIDISSVTFIDVPKPRTTATIEDQSIIYNTGPTLRVNRTWRSPDVGVGNTYILSLRD